MRLLFEKGPSQRAGEKDFQLGLAKRTTVPLAVIILVLTPVVVAFGLTAAKSEGLLKPAALAPLGAWQ